MHKRRLSITAISGVFIELLNKLVPLILIYYAQKKLGLDQFGLAMYGVAVIELFLPWITFGYNHFGSVSIAEALNQKPANPDQAAHTISNIVCLRLIHGVVIALLVLGTYWFTPQLKEYFYLIACLSFTFFFSAFELIWVQLARQNMVFVNIVVGLSKVVSLLLILLLVKSPEDAIMFAVLLVLSSSIINLVIAWDVHKAFKFVFPTLVELQNTFKRSYLFAVVFICLTFLERFDILVIEWLYGKSGAGLYSGPARLGHSLFQMGQAIVVAFFSEMIIIKDRKSLSKHLEEGLWGLSIFLSPILFGICFVSRELLTLIFDKQFAVVASSLNLLTFNAILSVFIYAFGLQILVVKGEIKKLVYILIIGTVSCCFLGVLGGVYGSFIGVAAGVGLGKSFIVLMVAYFSSKHIEYFPWLALAKGLFPGLLMALFLYMLQSQKLVVNIIVGAGVYFFFLFVVNKKRFLYVFRKIF